jgi:predicted nucleotidyltransferase
LDSDIDVAIIFDDFTDAFDMRVDLMKLRRQFDTKIEPHPFRKADFNAANPIAHEILKTGLEIL